MKIAENLADDAILKELGVRLVRRRLDANMTQAELAEKAAVVKRTVERMEEGGPTQLLNLVRICRALELVLQIIALVPESVASPLALLKLKGRERQRASGQWQAAPKLSVARQ